VPSDPGCECETQAEPGPQGQSRASGTSRRGGLEAFESASGTQRPRRGLGPASLAYWGTRLPLSREVF
jgi:hypothetical protein